MDSTETSFDRLKNITVDSDTDDGVGGGIGTEEEEKNLLPDVVGEKRKRRLTSKVWTLFYKLPLDQFPDGEPRCKCRKCGIIYKCPSKSGTGNMRKHMDSCPKLLMPVNPQQMLLDQRERSLGIRAPKFEIDVFRELVSAALIMHDLPFQFVEYEGIRRIFHYLSDEVQVISRNTTKADVLKMYKKGKENIRSILEATLGRISLTSDLWTSITTDGYLSLTAHFIDKDWVL